jgi:PIN domain nuclease of toxin-antitoxin system
MAVLNNEPGRDFVFPRLSRAAMSAVNFGEVAVKMAERGVSSQEIEATLLGFHLDIHPFDTTQAFAAAALRAGTRRRGLSFGDRACLALAAHLGATALTADRAWAGLDGVELIR